MKQDTPITDHEHVLRMKREGAILAVAVSVFVVTLIIVPKTPSGIGFAVLLGIIAYGAGVASHIPPSQPKQ